MERLFENTHKRGRGIVVGILGFWDADDADFGRLDL
jgi:hypothetical protein